MYVCMYMYRYIYIYVCVRFFCFVRARLYTDLFLSIHTHMHTYVSMHIAYIYIYIYIYMHIYLFNVFCFYILQPWLYNARMHRKTVDSPTLDLMYSPTQPPWTPPLCMFAFLCTSAFQDQLQSQPDLYKTSLCSKFTRKGFCKNGDSRRGNGGADPVVRGFVVSI